MRTPALGGGLHPLQEADPQAQPCDRGADDIDPFATPIEVGRVGHIKQAVVPRPDRR